MSLRSMTGFGRSESTTPLGHFSVEIKSVNSRFLEAKGYLPPPLSGLDPELRSFLQKRIRRGKVECRVRFTPSAESAGRARINEEVLRDYAERLGELRDRLGLQSAELSMDALLRLPGTLESSSEELEMATLWKALRPVVEEALEAFDADRSREGEALAQQIRTELELLRSRRNEIDLAKATVVEKFRDRLQNRINQLSEDVRGKADPGRLEVEITLYADRCDISEELVRLEAHLARLEELISQDGKKPAGKALDFLIQEILREVNTTSSKLRDLDAVSAVLDMKGSIERLREQIQNIE